MNTKSRRGDALVARLLLGLADCVDSFFSLKEEGTASPIKIRKEF
jgi:hypothetical protein